MSAEWVEVGRRCSQGRRSLWVRIHRDQDGNVVDVEMKAGREGDDDYARIGPDNPAFWSITDVLTTAVFAVQT